LWPNIRFLPSIVDEKNATKNRHIQNVCSMCIKINKVGKQEVGIWWVQKHLPRYGVPIWSLWPNIRSLPSIVAEKNVTKNELICSIRIKWQKSDIWSQASYRYPISWEAFLNPSDSYFLFADFVHFYTHWTYKLIVSHIFLSNYWWQRSDIWSQASYCIKINKVGKQEVGIWWVQKHLPRYGVPIWSLWPIVAEKNATKNVHICSMCIKAN
jgi:hypothetical protein